MSDEITRRRRLQQIHRIAPLIGNLIDRWEALPNDERSDLEKQCPAFCAMIKNIIQAMEVE